MNRARFRIGLLLAAAFAVAPPAPAAKPVRSREPAERIVLTVASFPAFDGAVKAALPRWNELHPDIRIELRSLAFGDHHKKMIAALERGTDVPDVIGVEIGFLGRLAATKGLEDLGEPPYSGAELLPRFLGFASAQARFGGSLAALPADVGPGTLLYRKDLLDEAGVTVEELTRSWESYVEAGRRLKAKTGASLVAHANDVMNVALRAGLEDGQGVYLDDEGAPLFESPRFRRAFALARKIREAGLDAGVGAWSNEWAEGLKRGTIATIPVGSWLTAHLENWLAPDSRGLWRAAQLPGRTFATWGGSFFAIPKAAEHKEAAWEFLRFMCLDREQQLRGAEMAGTWPALLDAQDAPWVDEELDFLGGQKARRLWQRSAASVPATAVHMLDPIAYDFVSAELEQVLENDKDIREALADARAQFERRVRRSPRARAPDRSDDEQVVLTVAAFPNLDEAVKAAIPRWNELHPDVRIELKSLAFRDHHEAMIRALEKGEDLPDVMAVEVGYIERFAISNGLEDLGGSPYGGEDRLEELLPFTAAMGHVRGDLVALPIDAGPGTLLYRKDLLARAGVTEAELTRSWESFIRAGKKLKARTGASLLANARELASLSIRASAKDGEGLFFGPGQEVRVDGPRFRRAFQLALSARRAGLDAKVEAWSTEWADALRKGKLATLPIGSWMTWHLDTWLAPDARGLWRAAQLPGGAHASWGGSFLAIPSGAAHKDLAWEFVQFMAYDPEQQLAAFEATGTWPVLQEAQDGDFVDEPVPYLGGQRARRLWKTEAAKIAAFAPHVLDPVAWDVLYEQLDLVLDEGKDVDRALADAQRKLERKIRK